jgi:hypothetical protein
LLDNHYRSGLRSPLSLKIDRVPGALLPRRNRRQVAAG